MDVPETRYVKSGTAHIAYQVLGNAGIDLVVLGGFFSHIEVQWEEPSYARFLERLASFTRLIMLDQRGTGLSDRVGRLPTLEQQVDDVLAVMDAVGSERAVLFGVAQGGPLGILIAAAHPGRTSALVLWASYARLLRDDDYPWGRDEASYRRLMRTLESTWGSGGYLDRLSPSVAEDTAFRRWWAKFERHIHSPGSLLAFLRLQAGVDVRAALHSVRTPTLVLQRRDDIYRDPGNSRYLADMIPEAAHVELPGRDHLPFVGDQDAVLDEIQEFLTGIRLGPTPDRVLATVLFTDVVGSTAQAAQIGDQAWRDLLERHNMLIRKELGRFRGREIHTVGDGFLATFDGPARAVRCAQAICVAVRTLGLEVRAGVHTAEIELVGDDIRGLAVHIAARVMSAAGPGEVLASATVKDLVFGSGIEFDNRGTHVLKGVPGEWQLLAARPT
jgi:pimeloyl-ACP methyl ester carboxylesterase